MILGRVSTHPPYSLADVWDLSLQGQYSVRTNYENWREALGALTTGDWVKLLVISRAGNENSFVYGYVWAAIKEFIDEGFAVLGEIKRADPAIPETLEEQKIVFYPHNVVEMCFCSSGDDDEPEHNTF